MFPDTVSNETVLDEVLSQPSPQLVEQLGAGTGDLVVLGAGGKMGPTLVRMAHRALRPLDGTVRLLQRHDSVILQSASRFKHRAFGHAWAICLIATS